MSGKIRTIVMIVFALIFVVVLAVIMATIMSNAERANTQLVDTLDANAAHSLQTYESGTIKGSSVIGAINNIRTIGGQNRMDVRVTTGTTEAASRTYEYEFGTRYTAPSNSTAFRFINPSGDFSTTVVRNANQVPIRIDFVQVGGVQQGTVIRETTGTPPVANPAWNATS
jgi:type II secretory pathway pseudopilin PulG